MVKMTPLLWCAVFLRVMFSGTIWFSWLFMFLYCIIGYGYVTNTEVTWDRVLFQGGALLAIAFFCTLSVAINSTISKDV
jgi:hypothetical protein